jgi:putative transposase
LVELAELTSTKRACVPLGKSRATHYRRQRPKPTRARAPWPAPRNKLTLAERAAVLATLNRKSSVDNSVAPVWATLLDEGSYLCSESTMYRIPRQAGGYASGAGRPTRGARACWRPAAFVSGDGCLARNFGCLPLVVRTQSMS